MYDIKIYLFFVLSLSFQPGISQNLNYNGSDSDTAFTQNILYNGRIYQSKNFSSEGHPFLGKNMWLTGTIILNDISFSSVQLKYDIVEQNIVLNLSNGSSAYGVVPNSENIKGFKINNDEFVKLIHVDAPDFEPGFYKVLCSGKINLYVSYKKFSGVNNSGLVETKEYFFIQKGSQFEKITSRKNLYHFFEGDDVINDFIKEQIPHNIKNEFALLKLCNCINTGNF